MLSVLILHYFSGVTAIPEFFDGAYVYLSGIFLQATWAVPAYLFFCAFLYLYIDQEHQYQALFPFTAIPFATVILFLQVMFGSADSVMNLFIAEQIGQRSAALILLFIFVLESVLFFVWSLNWFSKESPDRSRNYVLGKRVPSMHDRAAAAGKRRIGDGKLDYDLEVKTSAAGDVRMRTDGTSLYDSLLPSVGEDDDHHFHELTLSFPDIPDLPILRTISSTLSAGDEDLSDREKVSLDTVVADDQDDTRHDEEVPDMSNDSAEDIVSPASEDVRPIHGKLHSFKPPERPEEESVSTIAVGSHTVPIIPPEDPEFKNAPAKNHADDSASAAPDESEVSHGQETYVPGVAGLLKNNVAHTSILSGMNRIGYMYPPEEILDTYPDISREVDRLTKLSGEVLMQTLREFKIEAQLTGIQKGPVVTMYEILPAPGIRVQSITNLADNIALQLAASRVRIVAPIPGKQAVGIEVPNKKRSIVSFKEMLLEVDKRAKYEIPVVLGKDITGESQVIDLVKTPHLLIAGATGSGKSVCVNSLICSILFRRSPKEVRLMMVDPKIVELKLYNDIPHLLTPVITDSKKAIKALQYCIYEMERRYELLDNMNVRDIKTYNKRIDEQRLAREKLPYIVLVIDEFADLMTTTGKEMETYLARLAAMARAVGIHLVLATQRPSTNVITGIIKANIPSRIAFMVASNTDSRIILDQPGAEKLLGRGDMLFSSSWDPNLLRLQGAFLSEEEVERIVGHVKKNGEPDYLDEEYFMDDEDEEHVAEVDCEEGTDPLMEEALKIVYSRKSASASYLQRRLKIGYNRAARLVEEMEDRGIVGPARGSLPREVLRMTDID